MNTFATLTGACRAVLATQDAAEKAHLARAVAAWWQGGDHPVGEAGAPDRPARPDQPELLEPKDMPKRGFGGERGRIALLHALAHIELNAIDLAFDLVARFASPWVPTAFYDDWIRVGDDEARHFLMLDARLEELGSQYGALPAHDGLWQSAEDTAHDLAARLAIVPMVHEARGLDVTPGTIARLRRNGDEPSAALLDIIYHDEIHHVKAGTRWFGWVCEQQGHDPAPYFKDLLSQYFKGLLKPPFNEGARAKAGLTIEFYK